MDSETPNESGTSDGNVQPTSESPTVGSSAENGSNSTDNKEAENLQIASSPSRLDCGFESPITLVDRGSDEEKQGEEPSAPLPGTSTGADEPDGNGAPPLLRCTYCGKAFRNRHNLDDHVSFCQIWRCVCPYPDCPRVFRNPQECNRHFNKHSGAKNYHCPNCGKGYRRKQKVKQHIITHHNASVFFDLLKQL